MGRSEYYIFLEPASRSAVMSNVFQAGSWVFRVGSGFSGWAACFRK
jgi:hypothetical protein